MGPFPTRRAIVASLALVPALLVGCTVEISPNVDRSDLDTGRITVETEPPHAMVYLKYYVEDGQIYGSALLMEREVPLTGKNENWEPLGTTPLIGRETVTGADVADWDLLTYSRVRFNMRVDLKIEKPGYKIRTVEGIHLVKGEHRRFHFKLAPAPASQPASQPAEGAATRPATRAASQPPRVPAIQTDN
jgi:hypothetical protein